jgi:hypothetical protein
LKLGWALAELRNAELGLAEEFRSVGERHRSDHDVFQQTRTFAGQCEDHAEQLRPIVERYGADSSDEAELLGRRPANGRLLDDLRELYLGTQAVLVSWVIVNQGAMAARDKELLELISHCHLESELQMKALLTQLKTAAPQALTS